MKSILTPIDGSDQADVALDFAADIAAKYNAHLRLLHVGLRQKRGRTELFQRASRSFERAESEGEWTSDNKNWPRELQILDHMGHMILQEGAKRAKERGVRSVDVQIDWG